eukprot:857483-Pelagomonas_calceolata.AAC.3
MVHALPQTARKLQLLSVVGSDVRLRSIGMVSAIPETLCHVMLGCKFASVAFQCSCQRPEESLRGVAGRVRLKDFPLL